MFKTAVSKLPALLLALCACLCTASGPMRVAVLSEGTESETTVLLEGKEFCQHRLETRRLRAKSHQPRHEQTPLLEETILPLPVTALARAEGGREQDLPPLLRAPPCA